MISHLELLLASVDNKAGCVNSKDIKPKITELIKIVSIVLITGAIGLEAWHIYAVLNNLAVPSSLRPVFGIERFALVAHAIEGITAAIYAPAKGRMPIQYGVYTFFVGTIGLVELFDKKDS